MGTDYTDYCHALYFNEKNITVNIFFNVFIQQLYYEICLLLLLF